MDSSLDIISFIIKSLYTEPWWCRKEETLRTRERETPECVVYVAHCPQPCERAVKSTRLFPHQFEVCTSRPAMQGHCTSSTTLIPTLAHALRPPDSALRSLVHLGRESKQQHCHPVVGRRTSPAIPSLPSPPFLWPDCTCSSHACGKAGDGLSFLQNNVWRLNSFKLKVHGQAFIGCGHHQSEMCVVWTQWHGLSVSLGW